MLGSFLGPSVSVADDLDETVEELSRLVREELDTAEVGGDFAWTQGDVATELQRLAATENADLIVVGAYSHARTTEMIFGGVTRSLLRDAAVPLLIAH